MSVFVKGKLNTLNIRLKVDFRVASEHKQNFQREHRHKGLAQTLCQGMDHPVPTTTHAFVALYNEY